MSEKKNEVLTTTYRLEGKVDDFYCGANDGMSSFEGGLKRCIDVLGSVLGMILFFPAFVIFSWLIKREDGGPAIFKQERIGYKGKTFILYKFRSMSVSSEADGTPLLYKENDERLTKIGKFLRLHHLDEFPQLWNVLKGDMSIVGPRPERPYFVEKIKAINPNYELLYQLRPGLVSPATLYNGYADSMDKMLERLRMDLEYLHNRSLWLDFKIIWLTAVSIFSGKKF